MARAVTVIPPTVQRYTSLPIASKVKRRVAGYARVSTGLDEQLTSYQAQVDFYTKHIKENSDWEFVEVYTDEGISATSTKKRDGFNRMVSDALAGKIDLILTKSVSRFARNTVDSLTTVRLLKEKGVEIYFEKENIFTLDSKGELLITIMSSLAQEESRSLSENITWGQRKRFADGKVSLPYKHFLGYKKGTDGLPEIVEDEANVVRLIYKTYLEGRSPRGIATMLSEHGIPTPSGKKQWRDSTVESILTNEKYKGDAILQKHFTVDFLTKKQKINEGEVPQYYVEHSHPAIISAEVFDLVQHEMEQRKGHYTTNTSSFSSRIVCGDCGSFYGTKVWHSTDKYRRVIWQCNSKFKNGKKCMTPHLTDEQIKATFIDSFNSLLGRKTAILQAYNDVVAAFTDNKALNAEAADLQGECDVMLELMRKCVEENVSSTLDQTEYIQHYDGLVKRYEVAKGRLDAVKDTLLARRAKQEQMEAFIKVLRKQNALITEFDESLFGISVDRIIVSSATEIIFIWKDGTQAPWTPV